MEAKQFYENRIVTLKQEQKILQQRKSIFGILRLGSIIAIISAFYFLWSVNKLYAIAAAIILIAVFIQLIYKDLANKAAIKHLQYLININEDELKALKGKYNQFEDGAEFTPHNHFYANDMDVFGRASLYQFLNRTTSELGAEKLAAWLLSPTITETILQRQASVKELATKNEWRQNLQAIGKESSIKKNTLEEIKHWLQQPNLFSPFKPWQWLRWVLPAIIITITLLY